MENMLRFFRTTIIGGVLFLIPLVFVAVILGKAFQIMLAVAAPLDKLIPIESVGGFAFVNVLAFLILILSCMLAGLVARSPWGKSVYQKIDAFLLQLIPGYAWIKGVTGSISDEEAEDALKPVFARLDDQFQIGFEIDRTDDGLVVVYLPGAPDPRAGALSFMTPDRIQPIDAGFGEVARSFKKLGRGSGEMLPSQAAPT